MLDAGSSHGGSHSGLERGDGDAAALAADVLPGKDAIGSALGGLGAPPLFPLLPHEELLTDEERAVSLQGFGGFGCAATAGVSHHEQGSLPAPRLTAAPPLRRCKHYHRRARLVAPCCKGEARGDALRVHAAWRAMQTQSPAGAARL